MTDFYVGQQVECIDDNWIVDRMGIPCKVVSSAPKKNSVYVISAIFQNTVPNIKVALGLNEFPSSQQLRTEDGYLIDGNFGWKASHFRPLKKRSTETGMAILQEIARTAKLPKPAKKKVETA